MEPPSLAEKLGMTKHISGLLIKAKRLGLDAEGLERLAIQRGCDYYHEGEPLPPASVSEEEFSDEELAIALLNPALRCLAQKGTIRKKSRDWQSTSAAKVSSAMWRKPASGLSQTTYFGNGCWPWFRLRPRRSLRSFHIRPASWR